MQAALVLENGKVFTGESIGAGGEAWGEVVFNTGMTGYQEVLTDPSYAGQIVCMTYPLIGNYGINTLDSQSAKIQVQGFIVKEEASNPNHWQMANNLSEILTQAGIAGIKGVDTRALTRVIREYGVLKGAITTDTVDISELVKKLRAWQPPQDLVALVSTPAIYTFEDKQVKTVANISEEKTFLAEPFRVVVMDFGIKENILRTMQKMGFRLIVVPYSTTAEEILELDPDGIFLSNGPGDPKVVQEAIKTIQHLIGKRPIFGVYLGHQLLTLAMGGDTYKLKFGHRGGNQPVQDLRTSKVTITAQNHGYAVDSESLAGTPLRVTHLNLNDQTVEGVEHTELPVFSVQYHPEAGPGPQDSQYLFTEFARLMSERRVQDAT